MSVNRDEMMEDLAWLRERGYHSEKGDDDTICNRIADGCASLIAENGRLREALKKISDGNDIEWVSVLQEIARGALASADTHPQGGDVKQAPFTSGAVP